MRDLNVLSVQTIEKPAALPLFGGAISASVTEANATSIDMTKFNGGVLDFKVNSGAGTFAVAVYGSEVNSGVFKPLYKQVADGTFAAVSITTTTTVSAEYAITGLLPKYIKFVPTLTSTANATFTFTPAVV